MEENEHKSASMVPMEAAGPARPIGSSGDYSAPIVANFLTLLSAYMCTTRRYYLQSGGPVNIFKEKVRPVMCTNIDR